MRRSSTLRRIMQFGIAFNEASGDCLTRVDGNDEELKQNAATMRRRLPPATFFVALRNGFPINVLGRIQAVPEVVNIYCATANPVEVVVAETEQGRGVLGVIDGFAPKGSRRITREGAHGIAAEVRIQALRYLRVMPTAAARQYGCLKYTVAVPTVVPGCPCETSWR